VYELNKSYDQAFIVIGGVYVVDALVFAAAALLQSLRRQRRHLSATIMTTPGFDCRRGTRFQLSSDVRLTGVDAIPAVTVSPPVSTYGTVVATGGSATGQPQPVSEVGRADSGKRRNQTGTTTAPSSVHTE